MFANLLVPYTKRPYSDWDQLFSLAIDDWLDGSAVRPRKRVKTRRDDCEDTDDGHYITIFGPKGVIRVKTSDQLPRKSPKRSPTAVTTDPTKRSTTTTTTAGANRWKVAVDCQHFRPEELVVKTDGKFVTIHGKHAEREDNDDGNGWVAREFTRRYQLPDDCDDSTITSMFGPNGVLTVEADKRLAAEPTERQITVNVVNDAAVDDKVAESEATIDNQMKTTTTTITKVEE